MNSCAHKFKFNKNFIPINIRVEFTWLTYAQIFSYFYRAVPRDDYYIKGPFEDTSLHDRLARVETDGKKYSTRYTDCKYKDLLYYNIKRTRFTDNPCVSFDSQLLVVAFLYYISLMLLLH